MKLRRPERLIFMIFAGIGAIFLLVGILLCVHILDYDGTVETTGIITEISPHRGSGGHRDYDVYVSYEVDGTDYESRLNGYSSGYYEGKKLDIYYDRDDPWRIGSKTMDRMFLLFPGMGLLFCCIGGAGLAVIAKAGRRREALRENGYRVTAEYVETKRNRHYQVNNRNPYRVVCRWRDPETGETRTFHSENLWEDPAPRIAARNVRPFSVYLDRRHPRRYAMDTDWLTLQPAELP